LPIAIEHHLLHGLRELGEGAGALERARALDDEERVPSGDLGELRDRLRRKRSPAYALGDAADLLCRQRCEAQVDAVASHPRQPLARAFVEPWILSARRHDDEDAKAAHRLREEGEEIERQ
jgi:hypothetical protein